MKRKKSRKDGLVVANTSEPKKKKAKSTACTFSWLLGCDITPTKFFADYWEKAPMHISRGSAEYYEELCSTEEIMSLVADSKIPCDTKMDIFRVEGLQRVNATLPATATPDVLRAHLAKGFCVQYLQPEHESKRIRSLLSRLEDRFGALWSCNAYLLPQGGRSRTLAYDDVECFILQIEGSQRVRLYDAPDGQSLART